MIADLADSLRAWHDFYLLAGGASATLLGLVFVSVALVTGLPRLPAADEREAFVRPIILQFAYALVLSGLSLAPWHRCTTYGLAVAGVGVMAFVQFGALAPEMVRRHRTGEPVTRQIWFWHVVAPFGSALLTVASGMALARGELHALAGSATATFAFDLIGLGRSWQAFSWVLDRHPRTPP